MGFITFAACSILSNRHSNYIKNGEAKMLLRSMYCHDQAAREDIFAFMNRMVPLLLVLTVPILKRMKPFFISLKTFLANNYLWQISLPSVMIECFTCMKISVIYR